MSQPQELLPSPECTLPTPDQVVASVTAMHANLFEAASRPLTTPRGNIGELGTISYRHSQTEWFVKDGDIELLVMQGDQFTTLPTLESLNAPEADFRVEMRHRVPEGYAPRAIFTVVRQAGEDSFIDEEAYSEIPLGQAQIAASREVLRLFLAGQLAAQEQTVRRSVSVMNNETTFVSASETTVTTDDQPPRIFYEVAIEPFGEELLAFKARLADGAVEAECKDHTNYYENFPVHAGSVVLRPRRRDIVALLPETEPPMALRTDRVLTTGRLRQAERFFAAAVAQLDRYHQRYLELNAR